MKKIINKLFKIMMALAMVLSMCFTAGSTQVEAWNGNVPYEFTRVKEILYPYWWSSKIGGKQWSTHMCTYNGQYSYCLEASKKTPASGNYTASVIENNANVRKMLYYGFGGPGYNAQVEEIIKGQVRGCMPNDMKDYKDYGGGYSNGSNLTWEEAAYLWTHIYLSYAYSGDLMGLNLEAMNNMWRNDDGSGFGDNMLVGYKLITAMPEPSLGANFSTGNNAKFVATWDKTNSQQKTNTVKFNAESSETVKLNLQDNVTLHIEGGSSQRGGTATVKGGQSFYLTAPLENAPSDYTSSTLDCSAKGRFCALAISDGKGTSQTHGSWAQDTTDYLTYSVDWKGFGYISLNKKSANPDMTNTNKCYSLENAKYGIYQNGSLVQELTTDSDGYAKSTILQEGDYQVKETEASKGYTVDSQTYNVTVTKDNTVPATSNETPKNDPIGIEIVKNDVEDLGLPQGDATLEGAEFTVTYYGGLYSEEEIEAKKYETDRAEVRKWVIKTKKVTDGNKDYYMTGLRESYKVSGHDFFYDSDGIPTLPMGTITVQETKAPEGYMLKGAKLNVTDTATGVTSTVTDGKFYAQITEEYQGAKLQFGNDANQLVAKDKVKKQKIQIFKSGYRNGMSEVVKGLQGAEFTFKLKSEVDHVGWDNATVYDTITTDESGWALTKELPYGTYLVRETVTPKDYYTNPDFTVSVTQDTSEIKREEDKIKKIILNNRPVETQLRLVKKDKTTGKTVTLNSASFKIVADEDIKDGGNVVYKAGQYITQKVGGKKYDTFTTNADNVVVAKNEYTSDDDTKGEVILPLQLFAGKYHLEEVKVSKGFLTLGQSLLNRNFSTPINRKLYYPIQNTFFMLTAIYFNQ